MSRYWIEIELNSVNDNPIVEDKVSMGTIAARDCMRVLELTEQVAAAVLLAAMQGMELRIRDGALDEAGLHAQVREQVFTMFEFLQEDRPLEAELRHVSNSIREQIWPLYD